MKKLTAYCLLLTASLLSAISGLPSAASAVCPVCTVAVGAGLGLSRYLGIDDTIAGVWVGGLILSTSFWLVSWLQKKNFKLPQFITDNLLLITIVFILAITFIPLYFTGLIGHPSNTLFGIDKLLIGTTLGSIAFLIGLLVDQKSRKIKGEKLFPYQKVIFPLLFLVIISLVFYLYTKP